ncbi:MAG: L-asparaginase / beta-aspartyl-peptidase [Thermoleophilaceae bacterium]|nr:L-asparaginase / beta-aspartyl-peptidase [Thermoleophilaceae bacterium]
MKPVIVVHGGCGNPAGDSLRDEPAYHAALAASVEAAAVALGRGGSAIDAAQAAVESLEDAPLFNAGRGSVLTADGGVEMDAAVMTGHDLRAGAVALVSTVRHPVALARAVMETTPHVLLAGPGAERVAAGRGLERQAPDWFVTERQRERWWRARQGAGGGEGPRGTVGAVVLDGAGRLAAATSTGGTQGQVAGRIGDSPLIGAGTYADARCAVSCTGDGEGIIRSVAAHSVATLVGAGVPLADACARVVHEHAAPLGGDAGLIAVDASGAVALPFNTRVMHRAWQVGGGEVVTGTLA